MLNSMTQEDGVVLSVFYNKRVVSLIRSGEKGPMCTYRGSDKKTNHYPTNERGWSKVEHINVQTIKLNPRITLDKPSRSSIKELKLPKELTELAAIHDIAYEVARCHNCHLMGWSLKDLKGRQINCESVWKNGSFNFKISTTE